MTIQEARKTQGYKEAYNKVKKYKKGFRFTIRFKDIPPAKAKGLKLVLDDCINDGLLQSVSMGFDLYGHFEEETYERI